jgi:hypothetical protein
LQHLDTQFPSANACGQAMVSCLKLFSGITEQLRRTTKHRVACFLAYVRTSRLHTSLSELNEICRVVWTVQGAAFARKLNTCSEQSAGTLHSACTDNWHEASCSPCKRNNNKNHYSPPPAPVFCLMFHKRGTQSTRDITRALRTHHCNTQTTRDTKRVKTFIKKSSS